MAKTGEARKKKKNKQTNLAHSQAELGLLNNVISSYFMLNIKNVVNFLSCLTFCFYEYKDFLIKFIFILFYFFF